MAKKKRQKKKDEKKITGAPSGGISLDRQAKRVPVDGENTKIEKPPRAAVTTPKGGETAKKAPPSKEGAVAKKPAVTSAGKGPTGKPTTTKSGAKPSPKKGTSAAGKAAGSTKAANQPKALEDLSPLPKSGTVQAATKGKGEHPTKTGLPALEDVAPLAVLAPIKRQVVKQKVETAKEPTAVLEVDPPVEKPPEAVDPPTVSKPAPIEKPVTIKQTATESKAVAPVLQASVEPTTETAAPVAKQPEAVDPPSVPKSKPLEKPVTSEQTATESKAVAPVLQASVEPTAETAALVAKPPEAVDPPTVSKPEPLEKPVTSEQAATESKAVAPPVPPKPRVQPTAGVDTVAMDKVAVPTLKESEGFPLDGGVPISKTAADAAAAVAREATEKLATPAKKRRPLAERLATQPALVRSASTTFPRTMEKEPRERAATKSRSKLWLVIVGVLLLAGYLGGIFYYSDHFTPGTTVNGVAIGGKTLPDARKEIELPSISQITLEGRGNIQETLELPPIGYRELINPSDLEAVKAGQKPYAWVVEIFGKDTREIETTIAFDEVKLDHEIGQLNMVSGKNVEPPENAYVHKNGLGYSAVPEKEGTTLNPGALKNVLEKAIDGRTQQVDLTAENCYEQPEIREDSPEIRQIIAKMDALSSLKIHYTIGGAEEVLDYPVFSDWITLGKSGEITVDEEEAEIYIGGLAEKYSSKNKGVQFDSTNHGRITVLGGIYGTSVDTGAATKKLVESLLAIDSKGQTLTDLSISREIGPNQGVNTYIEIDITQQHMWYYVGGELFIDTGIVSGLIGTDRETPTGAFVLWSKETKRYLKGEDYKLWVEYWMPIDWTGVGIHDAPWQSSFGGDAYTYRGSHGCLNTPPESAGLIFNHIEVGTPVLIYKS